MSSTGGSTLIHRSKDHKDSEGLAYNQRGTGGNVNEHGSMQCYKNSESFIPVGWEWVVFSTIILVRFCAAFSNSISDCDETFNYWEPTHFLLFGKGHQTWEYDSSFALRSYLYLLVHAFPGHLYNMVFKTNRIFIFYLTKFILALISSFSELYFCQSVARELGTNAGRLTLAFLVLSAGMFISSTAFLPSSTSMFLLMLSHGAWFNQSYAPAIFLTALSAFLSWPFAALLGTPIMLDVVLRKRKVGILFENNNFV